MKLLIRILITGLVTACLHAQSPYSALQIPKQIQYQGRVATGTGAAWNGPEGYFMFAIFEGTTVLWNNWEGQPAPGNGISNPASVISPGNREVLTLPVNNGVFSVRLGDSSLSINTNKEIPPTVFFNSSANAVRTSVKLAVWFSPDGGTFTRLSPDVDFPFTSVPYAMVSGIAETLKEGAVTSAMLARDSVEFNKLTPGLRDQIQSASVSGGNVSFFDELQPASQGDFIGEMNTPGGSLYAYRTRIPAGNFLLLMGDAQVAYEQATDAYCDQVLLGESSKVIFSLQNIGDAALTGITSMLSGQDAQDWQILPAALPTSLAPGEVFRFELRFSPQFSGLRRANFTVDSDDNEGGLGVLDLLGLGVTGWSPSGSEPELVSVGDAGNPADPATGFGAVLYPFRVGKFEVTNRQYVDFLNSVDPHGVNPGLVFQGEMESQTHGGITFSSANAIGGKYSIKPGMGEIPVVYVTWFDCARYANWLHHGRVGRMEYGAYELSGVYKIDSAQFSPATAGARFRLPDEKEWYKSAYYHPESAGGPVGGYYLYPTRSNTVPSNDLGTGQNRANFRTNDYTVSPGNGTANVNTLYLTPVGTFGESSSYYGTFDQGGNVRERCATTLVYWGKERGGDCLNGNSVLQSNSWAENNWGSENKYLGFRVAAPSP